MPQKYEREIDEILRRMDDVLPREPTRRRLGRGLGSWAARLQLPSVRVTPTNLMLAGLVVAMLGYLIRAFLPWLATPLSLVALALFIGALALSIARNRRRPRSGWRGRSLDYSASDGLLWEGWLRRWREWRRSKRRGSRY